LEAFDLAAGGGVVRAAVLLGHVPVAELLLESVAAAAVDVAGQADGVDHAVVGEGGCGDAVLACGFAESGLHDRGGDPGVGRHVQGVAGAVVEPGDDLDALGERHCVGEWVVGEVGLPGLVWHLRLEPDVGRPRLLLRLGSHGSVAGQDPVDRGPGHCHVVVLGQVPAHGVGAGVVTGFGEFLAKP
jgi:hypothetical protein